MSTTEVRSATERGRRPEPARPVRERACDGTDPQVLQRFVRFRQTGDRALRNDLVELHRPLAEMMARRYAGRGEPLDDLLQVALLGLLKAVERFDPELGFRFDAFASVTIHGELKRHFRDKTSGRVVSTDAVSGEFQAGRSSQHASVIDPGFDAFDDLDLVQDLMRAISQRERVICELRFVDELVQREIAERLGISQMQVSRLLSRSIERMRRRAAHSRA